jgi:hypothetical protein
MSDALCNECGNARTMNHGRNVDYKTKTCDLKCAACGKITRHAFVVQSASVQALDPLTALSSVLRLHVVEVEGLPTMATLVRSVDVLLVRRGLGADDVAYIVGQFTATEDGVTRADTTTVLDDDLNLTVRTEDDLVVMTGDPGDGTWQFTADEARALAAALADHANRVA